MKKAGALLELYRRLSPTIAMLVPFLAKYSAKLQKSTDGIASQRNQIIDDSKSLHNCIWFHAASVGEYEQARPVIEQLKNSESRPIVVTHFSSSGYEFAIDNPAGDKHYYLPLDTPSNMKQLVGLLKPAVLVFAKYDCWPNLILEAEAASVPILLISGTLPPKAARLNKITLPLMRDVFNRFSEIGVCSENDAKRFRETMEVSSKVTVTGDTRAEQILRRFHDSANGKTVKMLMQFGEKRLVLGSTWMPEYPIWLPILPRLLSTNPDLKIIIVPHEPTDEHVEHLITRTKKVLNIPATTLSSFTDDELEKRILIVDTVGLLAEIYHTATIAYVGGGLTTGVHSTLEPAANKIPVLFGHKHHNAEEASEMITAGGGFVVNEKNSFDLVHELLNNNEKRNRCGEAAYSVLNARFGSVNKSVEMIKHYLDA
jgi:3-deoxy-D-manno-octulosonic-acid transferase